MLIKRYISNKYNVQECPITLQVLSEGDFIAILPCNHIFSEKAIKHWFKINQTCPICRRVYFINIQYSTTLNKNRYIYGLLHIICILYLYYIISYDR